MLIYFYSPIEELSYILAKAVEKEGHLCVVYNDSNVFTRAIQPSAQRADLLFIDYTSWNHDRFNLFRDMQIDNYYIPFIYYNDPNPLYPDLFEEWLNYLRYFINITGTDEETENSIIQKLSPVLKLVAELVNSKELKPYIPLKQQHKILPKLIQNWDLNKADTFTQEKFNILDDFKTNTKIPDNLFFLLEFFFDNKNQILSEKEILNFYEINHKKLAEKSIPVLVSQLRKYLKIYNNKDFALLKRGDGYVFKVFSKE